VLTESRDEIELAGEVRWSGNVGEGGTGACGNGVTALPWVCSKGEVGGAGEGLRSRSMPSHGTEM
jgi:hypothetical protein